MTRPICRASLVAVTLSLLVSSGPATAQRDLSQVEIKSQSVAGCVHMMQGAGGNLGVCTGKDGAFLIDDQFAPLTDKIRAAIAKITDQPLRFVLNTHWHGDHTGGNENLGKAGVLIIAHDNVRKRMSAEHFSSFFGRSTPPSPEGALPVVTFNDTVTFHLNGEEIVAFHAPPAHTDGDSIIYFKTSKVVHMGDIFWNGLYPFIDLESGGSVNGVIAAVDQVVSMIDDDTKVIPGHGNLGDKADLAAYLAMLREARDNVAKLMREGKSLEEVIAAKPTAKWDEKLGGAFINPSQLATFIYRSLGGE